MRGAHAQSNDAGDPATPRTLEDADTAPLDDWPVDPLYVPTLDRGAPDARPRLAAAAPPPGSNARRAATVAGALLLLLALAVAVLWAVLRLDETSQLQRTPPAKASAAAGSPMPRLAGMTLASAERRLASLGARVDVRSTPSTRPRGTVLAQAPRPRGMLASGQTVVLVVAAGPRHALPSLVGLDAGRASRLVAGAGLTPRVRNVDSDRPQGIVVRQQPASLAGLREHQVVTLFVSSGAVPVPRVVGLTSAAAAAALRGRGLTPRTVSRVSTRPAGVVVGQSPAAGAATRRGAEVRLEVSRHVARTLPAPAATDATKVLMPHVVGLSVAQARERLAALGLRTAVETVASTEQEGTVLGQTPVAGAQMRHGMTATLHVAAAPTSVPVPDVVGLDAGGAHDQLAQAGLRVVIVNQTVSDPSQDGVVIAASPTAGTRLARGATVTVTIGQLDASTAASG